MQIIVSKTAGENWRRWVDQLDGNIFHSRAWADTQRATTSRPLFFHWTNSGGQLLGAAVGVNTWSPRPIIGKLSKQLNFESMPVAADGRIDTLREMIRQLIAYAKTRHYRRLSLQSYMARVDIPDLADLGMQINRRLEFVINLEQSDDEIFSQFSTHHRRKAKKAKKHDMQPYEACTMEALHEFRKLQVMSRDRRLERGENIGILEDAYYESLGKSYFSNQLGRVFIMRSGEDPLSAAFVSIYRRKAMYMYGGSSDEGFRKEAPVLLFQHIFRRCRELGCVEFNMGGVPAESIDRDSQSHGLYRFKAGFGGEQILCTSGITGELNPGRERIVKIAKAVKRFR